MIVALLFAPGLVALAQVVPRDSDVRCLDALLRNELTEAILVASILLSCSADRRWKSEPGCVVGARAVHKPAEDPGGLLSYKARPEASIRRAQKASGER